MEPYAVTITSGRGLQLGDNNLQHVGPILDNRNPLGGLTFDNTKNTGLTFGKKHSPYEFEYTGVYIGDLPYHDPLERKPWLPVPWAVPHVSPPPANNHSYVYLNPVPASPWHVTTLGDKIELILDVPGVRPEDLNVVIESMVIKVTGKRADNGWAVLQTWPLGNDYNPATTEASMELGTLRLVIMKHVNKQSHQVKVTVK